MKMINIKLEVGQARITGEDLRDISLPEWITLVAGILGAAKVHVDEESWQTVLTMAMGIGSAPHSTVADERVKAMGPGEFSTLEPK